MPINIEIKTSVVSRDGSEIAYWTSGAGPPIVLSTGLSLGGDDPPLSLQA